MFLKVTENASIVIFTSKICGRRGPLKQFNYPTSTSDDACWQLNPRQDLPALESILLKPHNTDPQRNSVASYTYTDVCPFFRAGKIGQIYRQAVGMENGVVCHGQLPGSFSCVDSDILYSISHTKPRQEGKGD